MVSWRRLAFAAVLLQGALAVTLVARPDACADVWTFEHRVHRCCRLSADTRWHAPGRNCCHPGTIEERTDGGFVSAFTIVPAAPAAAVASSIAAMPVSREPAPDASIPERPPDRALRITVLLI